MCCDISIGAEVNLIEYLGYHDEANQALLQSEEKLKSLVNSIARCIERGGTIWTAGNGGSASTASHLACDLAKGVALAKNAKVKAICLNDNIAINTAWANDFSYEVALQRQLELCGSTTDLFIAISGSGQSENIINALNAAKNMKIESIAFLGFDGGRARDIADLSIVVESNDMQVIENLHLIIVHWIYKAFQ